MQTDINLYKYTQCPRRATRLPGGDLYPAHRIDDDAQIRTGHRRLRPQARKVARHPHRAGNSNRLDPGLEKHQRLADGRHRQTRRAQRQLPPSDLDRLVRFCVRAQRNMVPVGQLLHRRQIALQFRPIDQYRGRRDIRHLPQIIHYGL